LVKTALKMAAGAEGEASITLWPSGFASRPAGCTRLVIFVSPALKNSPEGILFVRPSGKVFLLLIIKGGYLMNTTQTSTPSQALLALPQIRIMLIREETETYRPKIKQSADVYKLSQDMINLDREEFRILLLDTKHRVTGVHTVSIGSLNTAIVHPREVFKAAVLANAFAIIALHNHPSGDPAPSPEDYALTKRLSEAGTILGIRLLDHVVIGEEHFYSFADHGDLE